MRIIRCTRDDLKQFRPVTGEPLLDAGKPCAPSVRGVRVDKVMKAPASRSPELLAASDALIGAVVDAELDGVGSV